MTNPETQNPTPEGSKKGVIDLDPHYQDELLGLLYLLEMQPEVSRFRIDEIDRHSDPNKQAKLVALKIDELCRVLGIPPVGWPDYLTECVRTVGSYREDPYEETVINLAKIDGIPVGTFIVEHADLALPIEAGDEGEGAFDATMKSPDGFEVFIRAEGDFGTVYINEDPETGECEGSEIEINIRFYADIKRTDD